MQAIFKKEIRQFFGSITGLMAVMVFLLIMGLLLFVFPATSLLDNGYATLDNFFIVAPMVLLFLVPAITMKAFADEFKSGTWELLATKPVGFQAIVSGKFFGALTIALLTLVPTLLYAFSLHRLSINNSIDVAAIAGSYIGLGLLLALYIAIGLFASALSSNAMIGFLLGALGCYLIFSGFDAVSQIPVLAGGADYYLQQLGAGAHYLSLSRGVVELKDVIYFIVAILLFLLLTRSLLLRKNR